MGTKKRLELAWGTRSIREHHYREDEDFCFVSAALCLWIGGRDVRGRIEGSKRGKVEGGEEGRPGYASYFRWDKDEMRSAPVFCQSVRDLSIHAGVQFGGPSHREQFTGINFCSSLCSNRSFYMFNLNDYDYLKPSARYALEVKSVKGKGRMTHRSTGRGGGKESGACREVDGISTRGHDGGEEDEGEVDVRKARWGANCRVYDVESEAGRGAGKKLVQKWKSDTGRCCPSLNLLAAINSIYFVERGKMIQYSVQMYSAIIQVPKALVRRDCPNLGVGK
ncbi:hypothetical protein K438DRAFT_1787942 [Mycena galopus ATCC 62051]|nr:hypothetical protein K438DRAFT_1787942 [Mycena galopus ATCC 62051]